MKASSVTELKVKNCGAYLKDYYLLIFIAFAVSALYVLFDMHLDIEKCLERGGRWNYKNNNCENN
jgi:hypothetical protein